MCLFSLFKPKNYFHFLSIELQCKKVNQKIKNKLCRRKNMPEKVIQSKSVEILSDIPILKIFFFSGAIRIMNTEIGCFVYTKK